MYETKVRHNYFFARRQEPRVWILYVLPLLGLLVVSPGRFGDWGSMKLVQFVPELAAFRSKCNPGTAPIGSLVQTSSL